MCCNCVHGVPINFLSFFLSKECYRPAYSIQYQRWFRNCSLFTEQRPLFAQRTMGLVSDTECYRLAYISLFYVLCYMLLFSYVIIFLDSTGIICRLYWLYTLHSTLQAVYCPLLLAGILGQLNFPSTHFAKFRNNS